MILLMLFMVLITTFLMILSFILPMNFNFKKEKPSTFESGLETSKSRIMFSLRFFLVSIIFLIFDTEIIILMPTPVSIMKMTTVEAYISLMFLLAITLSLILEWKIKALEWND